MARPTIVNSTLASHAASTPVATSTDMFSARCRRDVAAPPMKIQPAHHTTGLESAAISQLRASSEVTTWIPNAS